MKNPPAINENLNTEHYTLWKHMVCCRKVTTKCYIFFSLSVFYNYFSVPDKSAALNHEGKNVKSKKMSHAELSIPLVSAAAVTRSPHYRKTPAHWLTDNDYLTVCSRLVQWITHEPNIERSLRCLASKCFWDCTVRVYSVAHEWVKSTLTRLHVL